MSAATTVGSYSELIATTEGTHGGPNNVRVHVVVTPQNAVAYDIVRTHGGTTVSRSWSSEYPATIATDGTLRFIGRPMAEILRDARANMRYARERVASEEHAKKVSGQLSTVLSLPRGAYQWSDRLIPDDRLSQATRDALHAAPSGEGERYDVRLSDGRMYRVRVATMLRESVAVPLEVQS